MRNRYSRRFRSRKTTSSNTGAHLVPLSLPLFFPSNRVYQAVICQQLGRIKKNSTQSREPSKRRLFKWNVVTLWNTYFGRRSREDQEHVTHGLPADVNQRDVQYDRLHRESQVLFDLFCLRAFVSHFPMHIKPNRLVWIMLYKTYSEPIRPTLPTKKQQLLLHYYKTVTSRLQAQRRA